MNNKFVFSILNQEQQDEIVHLRHTEYKKFYKEKVDLAGLNWNKADKYSVHLGLRDTGANTLVAYLRLTGFLSKDRLEATTLFETPDHIQMPVALLTRAATLSDYESSGLHSILRCRALEICLNNKIETILGTMESSATRLEALKKLGYTLLATKENWGKESYIKSESGVSLIGLIERQKIEKAVSLLQKKYDLLPVSEERPEFLLSMSLL